MVFPARFLTAAALALSLAVAPAVQAREWHGGGRGGGEWHGGERHGGEWHGGYRGHRGGNAGAAIIGGLLGLGVGAAIASGSGYYAPPPAYYAPPPGYYAPPPPAVYYGY